MTPRAKTTTRRTKRRRTRKATAPPMPTPKQGERLWVLDTPYKAPAPGAEWRRDLSAHVYVGAHLPDDLAGYASQPYTWHRFLENTINRTPTPNKVTADPMTPRPLQVDGARAIARSCAAGAPLFLLADDPGVGKTLTSVVAAKAATKIRGGTRILVIADRPASITIPAWSRTIAAHGDGGLTWVVVTWDRIAKVKSLRWDVVVADEAQAVRHTTTKRWANWTRITGQNRASGHKPYLLLATATPGHTPLELPYLAPAFAHATGTPVTDWADLPATLADRGLHITKGAWTTDPQERAADTRTVNGWLTSGKYPATIHRPAPWGPVPLSGLPVRLTPNEQDQYCQEWGQFRQEMRLARHGKDVARGRAAVLRFRQKAALIRVNHTADWVAAQVENGKQVAVSVQYVETAAKPLTDALMLRGVDVARIYGKEYDTEAERVRFQTGAAPAVVFTPTAAINLHANESLGPGRAATSAPRVGVFHQARYSGIQGRQVCGRTHRDYQRSPWFVLYGENTVEETVARVMIERFAATADLVGGDTTMLSKIATLLGADWMPLDQLDPDSQA